jgi:hypothetical protein
MKIKYVTMNHKYAILVALLAVGLVIHSASADTTIPSWIKSSAKYWKEGQIGDVEYVQGMKYLIQNGVMQIPDSAKPVAKSSNIPSWVKNTAGWWADGSISDGEFVSSMQYLVAAGMISTSTQSSNQSSFESSTSLPANSTADAETTQCDAATTPADKQTCLDAIQTERDLKAKIANATPLVVGP